MIELWQNTNITLIMAIIPKGKADILTAAALNNGATGGTVGRATGTARSTFLQILGICDNAKEVIFLVTSGAVTDQVLKALDDTCKKFKRPFGVMWTINVENFFIGGVAGKSNLNTKIDKGGNMEVKKSDDNLNDNIANTSDTCNKAVDDLIKYHTNYKMITFIVNRGFSDVVMGAARESGALGGTVITARGTANPSDKKFLGLDIVPEKDMVIILCKEEIADSIINGVSKLDELNKKGSGVVYTVDANKFILLGSKE